MNDNQYVLNFAIWRGSFEESEQTYSKTFPNAGAVAAGVAEIEEHAASNGHSIYAATMVAPDGTKTGLV